MPTKKTATDQRLDDLSAKLDEWGARFERALEKHADDDKETFTAHDARIRTVETSQAGLSGRAAGVAAILTLLSSSVAAAMVKYLLP